MKNLLNYKDIDINTPPNYKGPCSSDTTILGRNFFNLPTRIFVINLYKKLHKLIGGKSLGRLGLSTLRMKVIKVAFHCNNKEHPEKKYWMVSTTSL